MKLTVVLAVLIGCLVLACSTAAPAPAEPTPNIDATVEAKLAQERAVDATVEARLKEEKASQPKAQVQPTNTQPPKPTNTAVPKPTKTPKPEPVPTVVPTTIPVPTPTAVPMHTPVPTPTPVPIPPTQFEGGFVLKVGNWYGFYENKNITFKIDDMSTDKTLVHGTGGQILVDLYANSDDSSDVVIDTSIRTNPQNPPWVLAGRAYIDGQVAPNGTWVTAWSDGAQIPGAAVQVNNNPTPKVPPGLEELLNRTRAQQRPAPTPCPWCEEPYQGPLKDAPVIILNAWKEGRQPIGESEAIGENSRWGFYSSLPEWRLANDLPKSESSCYGEWIWFGGDTMINPLDFGFSEGDETSTQLWTGWNVGRLCVP